MRGPTLARLILLILVVLSRGQSLASSALHNVGLICFTQTLTGWDLAVQSYMDDGCVEQRRHPTFAGSIQKATGGLERVEPLLSAKASADRTTSGGLDWALVISAMLDNSAASLLRGSCGDVESVWLYRASLFAGDWSAVDGAGPDEAGLIVAGHGPQFAGLGRDLAYWAALGAYRQLWEGRATSARVGFRTALRLDERNDLAYRGLRDAYIELGDWSSALRRHRWLVAADGSDAVAGWALWDLRDSWVGVSEVQLTERDGSLYDGCASSAWHGVCTNVSGSILREASLRYPVATPVQSGCAVAAFDFDSSAVALGVPGSLAIKWKLDYVPRDGVPIVEGATWGTVHWTQNLVSNGGFEWDEPDVAVHPSGFSEGMYPADAELYRVVQHDKGSAASQVVRLDPRGEAAGLLTGWIRVAPGQRLLIGGAVLPYDGAKPGIGYSWGGDPGRYIRVESGDFKREEWTYVAGIVEVPESETRIRLWVSNRLGVGPAMFDDLVLIPLPGCPSGMHD